MVSAIKRTRMAMVGSAHTMHRMNLAIGMSTSMVWRATPLAMSRSVLILMTLLLTTTPSMEICFWKYALQRVP